MVKKYILGIIFALNLLICGSLLAKFDATIPVIDLADYYSTLKHDALIKEFADAMHTVGFVAITNTYIDQKTLDDAYRSAQDFYNYPLDVKMKSHNAALNGQRGYVLSEVAQGQSIKDHKEFYHIAREYSQDIMDKYHYPPNVWPEDQTFRNNMLQLISLLDEYVDIVGMILAESIDKPQNYFNDMTRHGNFLLRSIHYPSDTPKDSIWAAAHTDIDLFTLLPMATAEGLQVLNTNGEWVKVVVPENALIVNAGDFLENITNGYYKSARHRVVSVDNSSERYSIVAFVHPRLDDSMSPLPEFIALSGQQKFANATSKELLFDRLIELGLHSQDLLQEYVQTGVIERLIDVNRASNTVMQTLVKANLASPKVIDHISEK